MPYVSNCDGWDSSSLFGAYLNTLIARLPVPDPTKPAVLDDITEDIYRTHPRREYPPFPHQDDIEK